MKHILNKLIPVALALMLLVAFSAFAPAEETGAYVLMNIPYDQFYAAEVTDASGLRHMCAKYIFEGTDAEGKHCHLYVENNGYFPKDGVKKDHFFPATKSRGKRSVTSKGPALYWQARGAARRSSLPNTSTICSHVITSILPVFLC